MINTFFMLPIINENVLQIGNATIQLSIIHIMYRTILYLCSKQITFRYPGEVANRLTCIAWQCWTVSLCIRNLIKEDWNLYPSPWAFYMENQFIAYFLYDIIVLLSSPRGRKQYIFFIHHFISLFIAMVNRVVPSGNHFSHHSLMILLESSTPLLNATKIIEEVSPHSLTTFLIKQITRKIYGITRILLFVPWLIYYGCYHYENKWNYNGLMCCLGLILYASTKWFKIINSVKQKV